MKRFLVIFAVTSLAVNLAWAQCGAGYYQCGEGCAPEGTNCCEEYSKFCPGDKPVACPKTGQCYKNHQDAENDGCGNWIICGRSH